MPALLSDFLKLLYTSKTVKEDMKTMGEKTKNLLAYMQSLITQHTDKYF